MDDAWRPSRASESRGPEAACAAERTAASRAWHSSCRLDKTQGSHGRGACSSSQPQGRRDRMVGWRGRVAGRCCGHPAEKKAECAVSGTASKRNGRLLLHRCARWKRTASRREGGRSEERGGIVHCGSVGRGGAPARLRPGPPQTQEVLTQEAPGVNHFISWWQRTPREALLRPRQTSTTQTASDSAARSPPGTSSGRPAARPCGLTRPSPRRRHPPRRHWPAQSRAAGRGGGRARDCPSHWSSCGSVRSRPGARP